MCNGIKLPPIIEIDISALMLAGSIIFLKIDSRYYLFIGCESFPLNSWTTRWCFVQNIKSLWIYLVDFERSYLIFLMPASTPYLSIRNWLWSLDTKILRLSYSYYLGIGLTKENQQNCQDFMYLILMKWLAKHLSLNSNYISVYYFQNSSCMIGIVRFLGFNLQSPILAKIH